jgi:hypothetical protein
VEYQLSTSFLMCCRPGLSCAQKAPIYALRYILPHRRPSKRRVRMPSKEDPRTTGSIMLYQLIAMSQEHVQQITRARFTTFTDAKLQSTSMQFSKMRKGYPEKSCRTAQPPYYRLNISYSLFKYLETTRTNQEDRLKLSTLILHV